MAGVQINNGFDIKAPRLSDMRSGKLVDSKSVPYASVAEALAAIPVAYRCEGLEFLVNDGSLKKYRFTADYATDGVEEVVGSIELTTVGNSGPATLTDWVLNVPVYASGAAYLAPEFSYSIPSPFYPINQSQNKPITITLTNKPDNFIFFRIEAFLRMESTGAGTVPVQIEFVAFGCSQVVETNLTFSGSGSVKYASANIVIQRDLVTLTNVFKAAKISNGVTEAIYMGIINTFNASGPISVTAVPNATGGFINGLVVNCSIV